MSPLYEVVTGQILLSRRQPFFDLHSQILLPVMNRVGIEPILLLITEVGRYCRFLDVYRYEDFQDYKRKTDQLLMDPVMPEYYERVGECIDGGIQIELMRDLPYAGNWA